MYILPLQLSNIFFKRSSSILNRPGIRSSMPELPHHNYFEKWNGVKVNNANLDKSRTEQQLIHDEALDNKLFSQGINIRKIRKQFDKFTDKNGSGVIKYSYCNEFTINDRSWIELKETNLSQRFQNRIQNKIYRYLNFYHQEHQSIGIHKFGTVTLKEGYCSQSNLREIVKKLKKEFKRKMEYICKKYNMELVISTVHFDVTSQKARPHIHFVIVQKTALTLVEWKRINEILSKIGRFELGEEVKSIKAVARYLFKIQNYSHLSSYNLGVVYQQLKGIRNYSTFGTMRAIIKECAERKSEPRFVDGQWVLVKRPEQRLVDDCPDNEILEVDDIENDIDWMEWQNVQQAPKVIANTLGINYKKEVFEIQELIQRKRIIVPTLCILRNKSRKTKKLAIDRVIDKINTSETDIDPPPESKGSVIE